MQSIRSVLIRIGIEFTPYYIFQESIEFTEIPDNKDTTNYSSGLLGPQDMKMIGTRETGFSESNLLGFLESGLKCIAIKNNNEIAAFMWINFTELSYKSTNIQLKNNEAYLWFMHTFDAYRGNNLAPNLRYKSYEILKEMGRDFLYSISDSFNSPAVRFKQKLNARKLKLVLFIQLFNKFRWSFILKSFRNNHHNSTLFTG